MTFEEALKALKKGKAVKRKEWLVEKYVTLKDNKIVDNNLQSYYIDTKDLAEDCWEECEAFILNRKEREYLGAVIKPFEDRVSTIQKIAVNNKEYRIIICVTSKDKKTCYYINLPPFENDSMYKNMDEGKLYYLLDLGLCTL